jgi:hypothetical protein
MQSSCKNKELRAPDFREWEKFHNHTVTADAEPGTHAAPAFSALQGRGPLTPVAEGSAGGDELLI